MSIRVLACIAYVAFFSLRAIRGKWFEALCSAIVLMAVMQHPDMPKSLGNIQGLNLWNILIFFVIVSWIKWRGYEGLTWDFPKNIQLLLIVYGAAIFISFLRMFFNRTYYLDDETSMSLISEHVVNCYKWMIPAIIYYDGCRTRKRIYLALFSIILFFFLLDLQVIKCLPLSTITLSGEELNRKASKLLQSRVGFNRVNLSMMLGGASWMTFFAVPLVRKRLHKAGLIFTAVLIVFGQALTGGRTGYVTWGMIGLLISILRYRKFLFLLPLIVAAVITFVPSVRDRMLMGIGADSKTPDGQIDQYEMTSGRNLAWPLVIEKIKKKPLFGYGKLAMIRTGVAEYLLTELGEAFPHPHNAYFEILFDAGWLGFFMVIPFYLTTVFYSARLLLVKDDYLFTSIGGATFSLVMALLIASVGSQTFYPREGSIGMWAAIGIMLRVNRFFIDKKQTGINLLEENVENAETDLPLGTAHV
ncbi:MAG: O-antigen ligase family protein [Chitinispirillaceae bacterium]|nr:O-antigen ligase family protein [Chitinispirillaceae bacterium]